MKDDYASQRNAKYIKKTRELLSELPPFCAEFFRGIDSVTSPLTRYAYAIDLRIFFNFLISEIPAFASYSISDFVINDLDRISVTDFECFLEYLTLYYKTVPDTNCVTEIENHENAKVRKISTLRAFYKYFYCKERITTLPTALVAAPKLHTKPIIRLEPNETADLLDSVDSGEGMPEHMKAYNSKTKVRDTAILTLFLGTGIRISELVGLNMDDINFVSNEFSIMRKGGNRDVLVFGDEVRSALLAYFKEREKLAPLEGHEGALFLSLQLKRMSVRAIEYLVKKYASVAVPHKRISPHKLRSTFGTTLYNETGDIYLVADVLGHKDINTTNKHYTDVSKDRRRLAAKAVKLRSDTTSEPTDFDNKDS